MVQDSKTPHPFGGVFGTIGGFAGLGLALAMGKDLEALPLLIFAFVLMCIGAYVGLFVEYKQWSFWKTTRTAAVCWAARKGGATLRRIVF